MEIIGSATLASAVFNSSVTGGYYANKSGCFGKLCRIVKKLAMEKTHCIVVPDGFNHYIHEQLFSTSESLKILDLERTFNLLFNKDTLSVLKRLKVESYHTYLAVNSKHLRSLLLRFKLNNPRKCKVWLVLSSVKLAKQLGVKDKNIHVFVPSEECLKASVEHINDSRIERHNSRINKENNARKDSVYFESPEALLMLVKKLIGEECQVNE